MVGSLFGFSPPTLAQANNEDLRVCQKCEAERLDRFAKRSCSSVFDAVDPGHVGQIIFSGAGNVEILRMCAHRLWVNPAVETNKAAREFITHSGFFMGR